MAPGDAETVDFRVVLVLRSLRERGLKVPSPHDPGGVVLDYRRRPRRHPRRGQGDPARGRPAAPPRPASPAPSPPGLGPTRPRARGRPGLHDLRPDHARGRRRPVPARHRHFEGRLPFRIARMLIDAEPDLTAFAALPREHRAKIRPQQPHRAPWAARPGAAPTSPRVLPDSDSARPLIGSVLPEQRGVAVRRTPIPLPGLTATPDRHAPHRQQHRRRQQSPRPARHHHLTERTPHQKT